MSVDSNGKTSADSIWGVSAVLDDPVQLRVASPPLYPVALRDSTISGRVELQYVVDTAGNVEPNSFKVLNTPHEAFVQAAKEAILKSVFTPARYRGRPVRQLVQQLLLFEKP